jgi:hypothetical protein
LADNHLPALEPGFEQEETELTERGKQGNDFVASFQAFSVSSVASCSIAFFDVREMPKLFFVRPLGPADQ